MVEPWPNGELREVRLWTDLTRAQRAALLVIVAMGFFVRLAWHHGRPFDGDEVGTLRYIHKPLGFVLTHFIDPWMTMNWYFALLKVVSHLFGDAAAVLMAPGFLVDVAGIAIIAALGLRVASARAALTAALLYALNPWLIQFAGTIRAYSMLTVFSTATLLLAYDWAARPSWRRGAAVSAMAALTILAHPGGVTTVLFAALLMLVWLARAPGMDSSDCMRRLATAAGPGLVAAAAVALAYFRIVPAYLQYQVAYTDAPPTPVNYLPHVLTAYFANGYLLLPAFAFLAVGCIAACRHKPLLFAVAALLPFEMLATSLQGLSIWPWAMARYLMAALPVLLLLVAEGLCALGRSTSGTLVLGLLLAATWAPDAGSAYKERFVYPSDALQQCIHRELREDDVLLAIDTHALHRLLVPYEGRWTRLPDALRDLDAPPRGRLVVVSACGPILTREPKTRLGKFQVTTYNQPTSRERFVQIDQDLLRTVHDRTEADMMEYVDACLTLQPIADPAANREALLRQFYECRSRTLKYRYPLTQMLGIPRDDR